MVGGEIRLMGLSFKIGKSLIAKNSKTYFIADIAANHDGSLKRALKLIKLAARSGANAAKFQHFKAETIVSDYGFKSLKKKLSHQSKWKKSVFQVFILSKEKEKYYYIWQIEKVLSESAFKNCGMTTSVSPPQYEGSII